MEHFQKVSLARVLLWPYWPLYHFGPRIWPKFNGIWWLIEKVSWKCNEGNSFGKRDDSELADYIWAQCWYIVTHHECVWSLPVVNKGNTHTLVVSIYNETVVHGVVDIDILFISMLFMSPWCCLVVGVVNGERAESGDCINDRNNNNNNKIGHVGWTTSQCQGNVLSNASRGKHNLYYSIDLLWMYVWHASVVDYLRLGTIISATRFDVTLLRAQPIPSHPSHHSILFAYTRVWL